MAHQFINPYNFIPYKSTVERSEIKTGTYTGYIDCTLETKTPLIMIDEEARGKDKPVKDKNGKEGLHINYTDTYKINEVPAIPGSELRGSIRFKFETLSNSCYSSMENLDFSGRYATTGRFDKHAVNQPGILDFSNPNNVILYACSAILDKENSYNSTHKIGKNGVYRVGEQIAKRRNKHFFYIEEKVADLGVQDNLKSNYEKLRKIHKQNTGHEHSAYTSDDLKPVWYTIDNGHIYIALGQNGQVIYKNKLPNLVPTQLKPCQHLDALCPTCRLFGTVSGDLKVSGRVRFSDALMISNPDNSILKQKITLPELANPKYGNAYFYLDSGQNKIKAFTPDFSTYDAQGEHRDYEAQIRGRKEYYHYKPHHKNAIESRMNKSVVAVKEGVQYTFKVYFNDLTETELEQLNMAITLGNYQHDLCHKLGAAKPLGYGSCKITSTILRRQLEYIDGQIVCKYSKYEPKKKCLQDAFSLTDKQLKSVNNMYSMSYIKDGKIIDYPRMKPEGDIFAWFSKNKGMQHKKTLPFAHNAYEHIILDSQFGNNQGYNNSRGGNYNRSNGKKPNNYYNKNKGRY